jgi:hypothetical protein
LAFAQAYELELKSKLDAGLLHSMSAKLRSGRGVELGVESK